jgi:hypothetical protein
MAKRVIFLFFGMVIGAGSMTDSRAWRKQDSLAIRNNRCVSCHSRLTSPLEISARYLDWHVSAHKVNGVGCDKCHGGDATAGDLKSAHRGMLPRQDSHSRLHNSKLPETCGVCHRSVVNSFVESTHYERLKNTGMAPSCVSCHNHMASTVARNPSQAAALCSFCHSTVNGLQPRMPEIPEMARVTLESMARTDFIVAWINDLLTEAQKKKIAVAEEKEELRLLQITLKEATTGWHAFNLDGPRTKADRAFEEGTRIKDQLAKKLEHD